VETFKKKTIYVYILLIIVLCRLAALLFDIIISNNVATLV